MPELDPIVVKLTADIEGLKKQLKTVEKQSKASAKKVESSFKSAFAGLAGAFAGRAILNSFQTLSKEAASFQQQFLGLEAAANQSGIAFAEVRKRALELTKDGQLGINNVSASLKILLSQGVSLDEAFKVTGALKQIAALNKITDNTGQAVQDVIKGVFSASAELVENADVGLSILAKRLGGFAKVASDANVRAKFFEEVLKRGNKLLPSYNKFLSGTAGQTGKLGVETEKLRVELGKAINSIVTDIIPAITGAVKGLRDFVGGLTGTQKRVLVFTATFVAFVPILASVITGLQTLVATLGAVAAAAGPIALVVGAVAGLATVIGLVVRDQMELNRGIAPLATNFRKILNLRKKTAEQEEKIRRTLQKASDINGVIIGQEEFKKKSLQDQEKILRQVNRQEAIRAGLLGESFASLESIKTGDLNKLAKIIKPIATGATGLPSTFKPLVAPSRVPGGGSRLGTKPSGGGGSFGPLASADPLSAELLKAGFVPGAFKDQKDFAELLQRINQLIASRGSITATTSTKVKKGIQAEKKSLIDLLDTVNNFNDEVGKVEDRRINEERINAIAAAREIAARKAQILKAGNLLSKKEAIRIQKELQEEITTINLSAQKKRILAEARRASQGITGLGAIASGDVGAGITGIGGFFGEAARTQDQRRGAQNIKFLGGLVSVGQQIGGAISNVTSFLSGFTDNSKEIARQEQIRDDIIRRQNVSLENQLEIQRRINELEFRRSRLLSEDTERQIKLNEILIKDEDQRARANLAEIQRLAEARAEEIGIGIGSPDEVAAAIARKEREQLQRSLASTLLGQIARTSGTGDIIGIRNRLQGLVDTGALPSNTANDVSNFIRLFDLSIAEQRDIIARQRGAEGLTSGRQLRAQFEDTFRVIAANASVAASAVQSAVSQTSTELASSNELLDLLIRIQNEQKNIAGSARTVELGRRRELSFIDVGRQSLFSLGQTVQGIRPEQLQLPTSLGAVAVATERVKSFQERQADSLEELVAISLQMRDLLALIAASVDQSAATSAAIGESGVLNVLKNIQQNGIGAAL